MMETQMEWTDKQIKQLKHLSDDGLSAASIANELGISRNAVIGKAHRIGLWGKEWGKDRRMLKFEKYNEPVRKNPPTLRIKPLLPPQEVPQLRCEEIPSGRLVALVDLQPHHCRWPIGDISSPDFGFCGRPIWLRSYCRHHSSVAYVFKNYRH
jgi:GcrA cell cycle regulator